MCQSAVPCGGGLLSSTIGCQRCPLAAAALLAVRPAVLKLPSPQGVRRPWCPPPLASAATPIKLLRTDSGLSPAVIVLHPLGFVLLQLLVPLSRMLAQAYVSVGLVIQGSPWTGLPCRFPSIWPQMAGPLSSRRPSRPAAAPVCSGTTIERWAGEAGHEGQFRPREGHTAERISEALKPSRR